MGNLASGISSDSPAPIIGVTTTETSCSLRSRARPGRPERRKSRRRHAMAAYVIVDIDVHDEPGMAEYRKLVPATVEKYGGRFAVRGGKFEVREGSWQPTRIVLLEFPNVDSARRWYDSPEYAPLLAMRLKASKANLVIVEGA